MEDFALIFREAAGKEELTAVEMESLLQDWDVWIAGIAAQNKLITSCGHLKKEGKVLRPSGVVTDGPFVEVKEALAGFILIKAESLDDATTLAHGCPILRIGGNIEIRPFARRV